MGYDGTLRFNTKIDNKGFSSGLSALKGLGLAAGAAVAGGLGYAVKVGASFESQMSAVGAISGASALPTAVSAISGLVSIISNFSGVLTTVVVGIGAYKVAMTAANVVTGIFSGLMAANPVGLAIAGIAAATTGIILLTNVIKDSNNAYLTFGEDLDATTEKYNQQVTAQTELAQKSEELKAINQQLASGECSLAFILQELIRDVDVELIQVTTNKIYKFACEYDNDCIIAEQECYKDRFKCKINNM